MKFGTAHSVYIEPEPGVRISELYRTYINAFFGTVGYDQTCCRSTDIGKHCIEINRIA